ncbi:MAG: DNA (cytosine-5-)-methyltransferase [Candidatus Gracilibacteria bacterium]|jgi:site-specific DNA-cytosine methylase
MLMVKSVPEGGNWRNIPEHIPSKRLEQIRISGGRTTLYGRLHRERPSYTITTYFNRPGNGTYIHPKQDRVISAREAARLQSFPDNYIFYSSKTSFCKQIGNAVPPLLSYCIAKRIKQIQKVKNVVDLFCGAGGLGLGFEWAGYNIVVANDNFPAACETYRNNHKKTILIEGDITESTVKDALINSIKKNKIDMIIGGPPCQGFSYAGKRLKDDPRNFLYKEYVEIVERVRPKVILIENVEGILTSDKGKTFQGIKTDFEELGYKLHGKKMHAIQFGVPQKRKRVVIIGVLNGNPEECFPKEILKDESKYITVDMAINNLPTIEMNGGKDLTEEKLITNNFYQQFLAGKIPVEEYYKILKSR